MKCNINAHSRRVLALLLAMLTVFSLLPTAAFAAQEDEYHDPAEHWQSASNRTNELDVNAVVTHETFYCYACGQHTNFTIWRTPEYTRDGQTAQSRNVRYSDGTLMNGVDTGAILDGTPGVDAYYTGYHWTKSCCDACGTMNGNDDPSDYGFSKNVYWLYDCAASFMTDLEETVSYEYADSTYHTKTIDGGNYCEFCFGTHHTHSSVLERHTLSRTVEPQIAHNRFVVTDRCTLCDYESVSYVTAKTVVANYFGTVDGQAHTLSLTDLSDAGVSTAIRYGNSAANCTMTTAPSYTVEGQYTVYYAVTYSYGGESMTENGVAYVWLRDESTGNCACGCGDADCACANSSCNGNCHSSVCGTNHRYAYLDTVAPTCTSLGYDRYVCAVCGAVEKRNYTNALDHGYSGVIVSEASCEHEGKLLEICIRCGDVQVTATPKGEHQYRTYKVSATCTAPGYTVRECGICGDRHIEDITAPAGHRYVSYVTAPTCTTGGHTHHICSVCGDGYIDSYTEATGHRWDDGTVIRDATCTEDGIIEYRCVVCDATKLEDYDGDGDPIGHGHTHAVTLPSLSLVSNPVISTTANTVNTTTASGGTGHIYVGSVTAPTCTERGFTTFVCITCGDSYVSDFTAALGHTYKTVVTPPTCTTLGYTTYTCTRCGDSYRSDYVETLGHNYKPSVTAPTCTEDGYTTYTCIRCGDSYVGNYSAALGHDWKAPVILASSTCNGDGVLEYDCTRCDAHYHAAISAKGHNPGPAATCLNPQACLDCGAVLAPAMGHGYKADVTAPACTKMGYTTYTCSACGDSYKSDYTEMLGHDYVADVIEPTCTEGGYTTYTCSRCGDSYVTDFTDPLGHDWDAGTKVTAETCNGEGVLEHHCTRCNERLLEAVSAKGHNPGPAATCIDDQICLACGAVIEKAHGHDYKATVTAPTCTELGFTTYVCADCGKTYNSDYVKAAGHKASDWIIDKQPSTSAEGSRHKECEVCHAKLETEAIEKLYLTATTDSKGEATVGEYFVTVADTASGNPVSGATVVLNKDGTISVRLPDGRLLDYAAQTTVTVLKDTEEITAVSDLTLTVTDKNGNTVTDRTNARGQLTAPAVSGITDSDGKRTIGYTDNRGKHRTVTVLLRYDGTGRPIIGAGLSVSRNGKLVISLPEGVDLDDNNRISLIVTDNEKQPAEGMDVTARNDLNNTANGTTGTDGALSLPETVVIVTQRHGAYINGYPNGTFGPSNNMTRSEAAAVFARLLAEKNGDDIPTAGLSKFADVPADAWYAGYVAYLNRYGVIYGTSETMFSPNREITRGEFVTMAVRFYDAAGEDVEAVQYNKVFSDVLRTDWTVEYIRDAAARGWIIGYEDGTFRPGNNITRAEVVTVVNRLLGRVADEGYIDANLRRLTTFTDMNPKHWAYYDVMEAANRHTAILDSGETWSK